jgi:hypothetical protein
MTGLHIYLRQRPVTHLALLATAVAVAVIAPGCGGGGGATGGSDGGSTGGGTTGGGGGGVISGSLVVFGYNDLGMHCMNQDFSEIMVLPPFNNLHAQVISRAGEPRILSSGVNVSFSIPGNTHSADKTNFWQYAGATLGLSPAANVGLTGTGLSGAMTATLNGDFAATGIPVTPITDAGAENAYQLATITATTSTATARTQAVVPVSWELSCNLCHNTPGKSVAQDILQKHDSLHRTHLATSTPVTCGKCHRQPPLEALGIHGDSSLPTLSRAMHASHSSRMASAGLAVSCYACHPGVRTQCQRDVHYSAGMTCTSCHISMDAVAEPSREPWTTLPHCGDCHRVVGHQYEQANTLYRNSRGHHNVTCESCHGSPHAITPTVVSADNVQAIALQGHAGAINTCTVCHTSQPDDSFPHSVSGGD